MKTRFISPEVHTPSMNMAVDEALLDSRLPLLRFYQWEPPGLSIGYFQSIEAIDTAFCSEDGIVIVRRITGGSAVLHENELTYSIIADNALLPASVLESYRMISMGILKALQLLGLSASMNLSVSGVKKSPVCFHEPSRHELLVRDKKIAGSAQRRIGGKVLQHGAIMIDIDIDRYARCFKGSNEIADQLRRRVTSISGELGRAVEYQEISEAMKRGFAEALGMEFIEDELTVEERGSAERLNDEKYSSDEWNFLR